MRQLARRFIPLMLAAVLLLSAQVVIGWWLIPPSKIRWGSNDRMFAQSESRTPTTQSEPPSWWVVHPPSWHGSTTLAYGWPWPMVRTTALHGSGEWVLGWSGTFRLRSFTVLDDDLAIDVMWFGLLGNAAVCAEFAIVTAYVVKLLRGHMRHKRGRCTNCSYDLHGLTGICPECGE